MDKRWLPRFTGNFLLVSLLSILALIYPQYAAGAPGAPVIDVWYGPRQVFGNIGLPQSWINILGNVSDPDGIAALTYSLNAGPDRPLSIGPDMRRLEAPGDFNVEIAYTDLVDGRNRVTITATDTLNNTAVRSVDLDYVDGHIWPLPYTIKWRTVENIQDVAQIVDGLWSLGRKGIRPVTLGYDRLIALGDISWTSYEVTVPITIHGIDPAGFRWPSVTPWVGIIMRWQGHVDWEDSQPTIGWKPFGANVWYTWLTNTLSLQGESGPDVVDPYDRKLQFGVRYFFKMRAQEVTKSTPRGGFYSAKVWKSGTPEPPVWDMQHREGIKDLQTGSLLLVAHHVDATFGNVRIVPLDPISDISPPQISAQAVTTKPDAPTVATFTWNTNQKATSGVEYGLTTAYESGRIYETALVTKHKLILSSLLPDSVYHYRLISADASGNVTRSPDAVFRTLWSDSPPPGLVSDEFDGTVLNPALWTFVNPHGDASFTVSGGQLAMTVPAGTSHDAWSDGNFVARVMQKARNEDFELEVKFTSTVMTKYQQQGVMVEAADDNFLRLEFHSNGTQTKLFAANVVAGVPTTQIFTAIDDGVPLFMRVQRLGNLWTLSYSYDGVAWTVGGSFSHVMRVVAVGVYAGNSLETAHTASIDYFLNTAIPFQ